ncbi:MAG: thioesterase [Acidobacteria bacterium]|nr:thioesterase [Acidobacteriota bacterium]
MDELVGSWAEITAIVTDTDTALYLGSGDVPVLGTPRVVALVEEASCAAISDGLEEGRTTVGTRIELDHLSPSAVGAEIIARAEVISVDGNWVDLAVSVMMGDEEVARGRHLRVVVSRDRFENT